MFASLPKYIDFFSETEIDQGCSHFISFFVRVVDPDPDPDPVPNPGSL
jgi:hypothetical protein